MSRALLTVREKQVKYVGLSDIRIIRKADWALIGIDHADVMWDKNNGWAIACSLLSVRILEYCQHDPELVIS